ncbi:hypothetical protein [Massilia sp. DWR3-1-1]|uniref:hypothetical protein n=1 Tax=Massilia sp. DWR3-1-1 TaxID=2804559 RepID=UPI003CF267D0
MDASDYALKVTPASKSLGILIRKAAWMGKGVAPQAAPGQHVETVECVKPAPAIDAAPVAPSESAGLAASPVAVPAAAAIAADIKDDEVVFTFAERRYRVRGLPKNLSPETLKINLLVAVGEAYHVDTLDLYSAKCRGHYLLQAARELTSCLRLKTHILRQTAMCRSLPYWRANHDSRARQDAAARRRSVDCRRLPRPPGRLRRMAARDALLGAHDQDAPHRPGLLH